MDSRAQKPNKSKTGKKSPCDQHTSPTAKPPEPDTSYARGGRVKKTGAAKLHKDEVVLPVAVVKRLQKKGLKERMLLKTVRPYESIIYKILLIFHIIQMLMGCCWWF